MSESESDESFEGSKSSSKRKAYTVEFKLQVVDFAKKSSNHAAANKYKVDRNCVIRWRRNEVSLCRAKSSSRDGKSKKKLGSGRKVSYEMLDNDLAAWIRQRRKEKKKISRRIIKLQAESMFNPELEGTDFKASTGWLEKFMKRHRFSLRERTTVCQKPPSDYTQKLVDFVMFIAQLRKNKSLDGSEDDLIHCFKEAGPVPEGRKLLEDARAGINDEPLRIEDEEIEVEEEAYDSDKTFEFDDMLDALTF